MSSSVSNPYTFNIQSNTSFSTRINKGIVDTFTITFTYSETKEYNYKGLMLACTDIPELASGHALISIMTYIYQLLPSGTASGFTSISFVISQVNEFPYSKVILNGGPFNMIELPKSDASTEDFVIFECNTAYVDKTWDNVTSELSIIYMD